MTHQSQFVHKESAKFHYIRPFFHSFFPLPNAHNENEKYHAIHFMKCLFKEQKTAFELTFSITALN